MHASLTCCVRQLQMPLDLFFICELTKSPHRFFCHSFNTQQSNPEGKDGQEFVLKAGFPPKDLIGDIDNSIQATSLAGEAITVRWK